MDKKIISILRRFFFALNWPYGTLALLDLSLLVFIRVLVHVPHALTQMLFLVCFDVISGKPMIILYCLAVHQNQMVWFHTVQKFCV